MKKAMAAMAAVLGMAAAGDELLQDWLAQEGGDAAKTNSAAWRAERAKRREARLAGVAAMAKRWVYCRHYVMGGSHYAYTEGLSDANAERTYQAAGSQLCMAEYREGGLWAETALLESKTGCYRDVDVSPDGMRVLYSYKDSDRGDDFHLYEMELETRKVRQLTFGKGVADYEGCYLPDGHIIFNSTRCIQIVDCWWTEVSNLYRCDADGGNITRITYDQVHDNYPALTWDGKVLYTRWEYNDRSQMYPQPLFAMNTDGTNQRAVYGGNSWFPTTIIHARAVPGTPYFFAIATGHHTWQPGELMRFDPREGREEEQGAWQVAPLRKAKRHVMDQYGQRGAIAAYPYPVDEKSVVLSYLPEGWGTNTNGWVARRRDAKLGLYWTGVDGERELLVARNGKTPCGRPVPVMARTLPARPSVRPDETLKTGTIAIRDVYEGEAMAGVERGTVKTMRVAALEYRPAGIGSNGNSGRGGGGLSCTPPGAGNTSWSVKRVLGEVPVEADGSVRFEAPARVPLYFTLLDAKGRMVQSMRSWTLLQPGEHQSCIGCHEDANKAPDFRLDNRSAYSGAPKHKVTNEAKGFSYVKEVQPILDAKCTRCHSPEKNAKLMDLTGTPVEDGQSRRIWTKSYVNLIHAGCHTNKQGVAKWVGMPGHGALNWINSGSEPTLLKPRAYGSAASRLFTEKLDKGHGGLTEGEMRTLACWVDLGVPFCGAYDEAADWSEAERARWDRYAKKREEFATEYEKNR